MVTGTVEPGTVDPAVVRLASAATREQSVVDLAISRIADAKIVMDRLHLAKRLGTKYANFLFPIPKNLALELGDGYSIQYVRKTITSSRLIGDRDREYLQSLDATGYCRHAAGRLEAFLVRVRREIKAGKVSGYRTLGVDFPFRQAEFVTLMKDFFNEDDRTTRKSLAVKLNHKRKDESEIAAMILADVRLNLKTGKAFGSRHYAAKHTVAEARVNRIMKGLEPHESALRKSILSKRVFIMVAPDNATRMKIAEANLTKIVEDRSDLSDEERLEISVRLLELADEILN